MDNQFLDKSEKLSQEQWDNLRSLLLSKSKNPERLNQLRQEKIKSFEAKYKFINQSSKSQFNGLNSLSDLLYSLPAPTDGISERQQLEQDLNDPILHKEASAKIRKSDRFSIDFDGDRWFVEEL